MTEISSAGAVPAFNPPTRTGSTVQPRSMHYARPSAPTSSEPAGSGAAAAFDVSSAARQGESAAPRRVDITV